MTVRAPRLSQKHKGRSFAADDGGGIVAHHTAHLPEHHRDDNQHHDSQHAYTSRHHHPRRTRPDWTSAYQLTEKRLRGSRKQEEGTREPVLLPPGGRTHPHDVGRRKGNAGRLHAASASNDGHAREGVSELPARHVGVRRETRPPARIAEGRRRERKTVRLTENSVSRTVFTATTPVLTETWQVLPFRRLDAQTAPWSRALRHFSFPIRQSGQAGVAFLLDCRADEPLGRPVHHDAWHNGPHRQHNSSDG